MREASSRLSPGPLAVPIVMPDPRGRALTFAYVF
jgi:hypothetical protein